MLALTLLGCIGGIFKDGPLSGDDTDDGPSLTPDPPAVWYVYRDTRGNQAGDVAPAELCEGAAFLGTLGGAAACLDDSVRGVVSLISTPAGDTWPETVDDEAEICPPGFLWKGGNGWMATCVRDSSAASVMLYYAADGRYYEDTAQRGDVCPSGTTWVGGSVYGAPLCVYERWMAITSVYQGVDGSVVEDATDGAHVCAPGWDYLGTWYGWSQCGKDEGTVVALYTNAAGRSFEGDNGDEVCPDGWDYVGSFYGNAACWTSDRLTQVSLYNGADGAAFEGDNGPEVCPDGWTFLGSANGAVVCVD